jgi:hypothetical protein
VICVIPVRDEITLPQVLGPLAPKATSPELKTDPRADHYGFQGDPVGKELSFSKLFLGLAAISQAMEAGGE